MVEEVKELNALFEFLFDDGSLTLVVDVVVEEEEEHSPIFFFFFILLSVFTNARAC